MIEDFDFRKKHITGKLNNVHENMSKRYKINKNNQDIKDAKEMTKFLQNIKDTQIIPINKANSTNIKAALNDEYKNLVINTLAALGKQDSSRIFQTSHNGNGVKIPDEWNADDIFEAELAAIFATLDNYNKEFINKDLPINLFLSGKETGNIRGTLKGEFSLDIKNQINEDIKNMLNEAIKKTAKTIEKKLKASKTDKEREKYKNLLVGLTKNSEARAIKTDVHTFPTIEIQAEVSDNFKKCAELFSNRRFTVKNYIQSSFGTRQISLGNTAPYKAIIAELLDLGYNSNQSKNIYYHSLNKWYSNKIDNASKNAIKTHIPHIRFVYELEGNGLEDENGKNILGADFMILNDPTAPPGKPSIFVKSTKELIYNAIFNGKDSWLQAKEDPFLTHLSIISSNIIK